MWRSPVPMAPVSDPVEWIEIVRDDLRIDEADDDARLLRNVSAAIAHVQAYTGLKLIDQTMDVSCTRWSDLERLPFAPVQSITSISYVDLNGASQVVGPGVYEGRLDGLDPQILLAFGQEWPAQRPGSLIKVRLVSGYGAVSAQPSDLVAAILILTRSLTDEGTFDTVRDTVDALLVNFRTFATN